MREYEVEVHGAGCVARPERTVVGRRSPGPEGAPGMAALGTLPPLRHRPLARSNKRSTPGTLSWVVAELGWQPSLFAEAAEAADAADAADARVACVDESFAGSRRVTLAHGAWLEVVPEWLGGADALFERMLAGTPWRGHQVRMYERVLPEPRLTHRWVLGEPLPDPVLDRMAALLSARYGVRFTQVGANLYRDGADSVAWHGDRVARELPTATVALVSLGSARPFRLRPTGGGRSLALLPGPGDLLVLGGSCQRTWQHSVPKARGVGARISVQFRHAYPDSPPTG